MTEPKDQSYERSVAASLTPAMRLAMLDLSKASPYTKYRLVSRGLATLTIVNTPKFARVGDKRVFSLTLLGHAVRRELEEQNAQS